MTWLLAASRAAELLTCFLPRKAVMAESWRFVTEIAGVDFEQIIPGQMKKELPLTVQNAVQDALDRLATGEPPAYVLGEVMFRDVVVRVDRRVLIPRPETEILVDAVLAWIKTKDLQTPRIVDLGTGTGCIAKALAHSLPEATIIAVDNSLTAVAVASANLEGCFAEKNVTVLAGDWLSWVGSSGFFDVVVSNPPYISNQELASLPEAVRNWEPSSALDGGQGGLKHLLAVIDQARVQLKIGGLIALEMDEAQVPTIVEALASSSGYASRRILKDLAGRERFVLAEAQGRSSCFTA